MNEPNPHPLSVAPRPLDFEGVTSPIPSVLCPRAGSRLPVVNCCHCDSFQEIAFGQHGCAVKCSARGASVRTRATRVSDIVRAPVFCAGPLTTLATASAHGELRAPWDAIPVLAQDARALGLITAAGMQLWHARGIASDCPLSGLMETELLHVEPSTSLLDAVKLLLGGSGSHLVVSAPDGKFLGLVAEIDLMRDLPAFRATLY